MTQTSGHDREQDGLPPVAILILNWNGWPDTLECLESVLRLDYPDFQVIVCDNGSTDGSVDHLLDWAAGRLDVVPQRSEMELHVRPPVKKSVAVRVLDR
ncbi:MAG: glycosyltransferase, partial [Proteobacteria bacterium]|nr:glycosyltransferase [Pseudomonadota bacterium]